MNINNKNAFTLVELIVVITILAILGTIAFISLQGYSSQARDTKRVSDIQNIKKSLELFFLNAGKYPLPDEIGEVKYYDELVWSQGVVGNTVTKNLSKNLNEKPLDPLVETPYTYSVINSQTKYELLSIYESDLFSLISQTNAAGNTYPKIDGNYNGVFVKTESYYIPTPSIINSEVSTGTLILDDNNIRSQIITGGVNNIAFGTSIEKIGGLTDFDIHTYTGTITLKSSDLEKEALAQVLIAAYSGTILANNGIYKTIAITNPTNSVDLLSLINNVVLNSSTYILASGGGDDAPIYSINTVSDCGIIIGEILYGSSDGTDTSLTCNDDIIVCNGITGSGITIAACNVGQTDIMGYNTCISTNPGFDVNIDCTTARVGNYYQFGKSDISWVNGNSSYGYDWKIDTRLDGIDDGSANLWGIEESEKTTAIYSNQNIVDQAKMQGPCASGYHVPTSAEWLGINSLGGWGIDGESMKTALKLPFAGRRTRNNGSMYNQGNYIYYRSSSPNGTNGSYLFISPINVTSSVYSRSYGLSVRCFKN